MWTFSLFCWPDRSLFGEWASLERGSSRTFRACRGAGWPSDDQVVKSRTTLGFFFGLCSSPPGYFVFGKCAFMSQKVCGATLDVVLICIFQNSQIRPCEFTHGRENLHVINAEYFPLFWLLRARLHHSLYKKHKRTNSKTNISQTPCCQSARTGCRRDVVTVSVTLTDVASPTW